MTLKTALEVARGTDASIHKMGYSASVEDLRHRALDALLVAWENTKLIAAAHADNGVMFSIMEEMESK